MFMMDDYAQFPRLIKSYVYNMPPGHSDDFRTLPRPIASVACVRKGSAEYVTEGRSFRLSSGDILFIPVGGTYISYWDGTKSTMDCFHFLMPFVRERRYTVQRLDGDDSLAECFSLSMTRSAPDFKTCELFYRVLGSVWNRFHSVETRSDPRIRPALDYLELSPERECTVAKLASLCHMSESHLYTCFRESVGLSPMDYRKRLLIMSAQRLLGTTELTISEIAERLGFGSETYFRRVFRSETGVSPREYRKHPSNL